MNERRFGPITFDDLCELKIGDTFYECYNGQNILVKVISNPVVSTKKMFDGNYDQVRFQVEDESGLVTNHLTTKGFDQYSNRYWEKQYLDGGDLKWRMNQK